MNSKRPWSVTLATLNEKPGAYIKDASGNVIAAVMDARDADYVVELERKLAEAEMRIEDLETMY